MSNLRSLPGERPAPLTSSDDAPFWEGVRARSLRLPWCGKCSRHLFPPGPSCPHCGGTQLEWRTLGAHARGRLHSFTIVQRSFLQFADQVPYVAAIVELEQAPGVRMPGNLIGAGADPKRLSLDSPLRLVWAQYANGVVLPQWELETSQGVSEA